MKLPRQLRHRFEALCSDHLRTESRENIKQSPGGLGILLTVGFLPPTNLGSLHRPASFAVQKRRHRKGLRAVVSVRGGRGHHCFLPRRGGSHQRVEKVLLRLILVIKKGFAVRAAQRDKVPALQNPQMGARQAREGSRQQLQIAPIILFG